MVWQAEAAGSLVRAGIVVAWNARAAVWRSPQRPDVGAAVDRIADHRREARRNFRSVRRYLRNLDPRRYA